MVIAQKPKEADAILLKERLGREYYQRRIAIEDARETEYHAFFSPKCTFAKIHFIRPLQHLFLRWTGLQEKGRREFLNPVVREREVFFGKQLPESFDGFRILQLSDLHIDIDTHLLSAISKVISLCEYDLCVMTGDYRNQTVGKYEETVRLMKELKPFIRGTPLLVLGNHDFLGMVPELERSGYQFLINESQEIERGGEKIHLVGIDDPVIFQTHKVKKPIEKLPAGSFKILLSHSPNVYKEAQEAGYAFLLAGHTHGGQVCLPGGRPVIGNDRAPREYRKEAWEYKGMQGYTSNGIGASGLAIRINCPPEAVIHTLRRP